MTYRCNIEVFEGPLDLLLHLIKEQKMDIQDIAIATITRQYMDYIDLMQDLNLEVAGEYLIMAAEFDKNQIQGASPGSGAGTGRR